MYTFIMFLVCSVLVNLLLIYVLLGMYSIIKTQKKGSPMITAIPLLQPSSNIAMPLKTF
jgi:hypothetical protein